MDLFTCEDNLRDGRDLYGLKIIAKQPPQPAAAAQSHVEKQQASFLDLVSRFKVAIKYSRL